MALKRTVSFLLSFVILMGNLLIPSFAQNSANNEIAVQTDTNVDIHTGNKSRYTPNIQNYKTEDGTEHTIYWAQGITPPKMTSDKSKYGKDGYFERDFIDTGKDKYITYQAPYEAGKGYFDLNKNPYRMDWEASLCYLGTAGNLLQWWAKQNEEYIRRYASLIKEGTIYEQPTGLKPIYPYSEKMWNDFLAEPPISYIDGYGYAQEITTSPLVNPALNNYFSRGKGFYMDCVFDFFINGYTAQPLGEPPERNHPDNFVMDKRGGYFYPIFGSQLITERLMDREYTRYEYFNNNIAQLFNSGKGIGISYLKSATSAHAITMWGAEYDENGNICRIFVTDSDDYGNTCYSKPDTLRGLHSMEIHQDANGAVMLTSNMNPNSKGAYLQMLVTIDLAQDKWEEKLADLSAPNIPQIIEQPKDRIYPKGANAENLSVMAEVDDTGYLTYQWYESDAPNTDGTKIEKAIYKEFRPKTDTFGTKYYYCEVINNKNGKTTAIKTKSAKIDIEDIPLIHAETPNLGWMSSNKLYYKQYTKPEPITVNAWVNDGGTLSYQWYITTDSTTQVRYKLEGETSNSFVPPTNVPGNAFYFCEVTNTNHGPNVTGDVQTKVNTKVRWVVVEDSIMIDAPSPIIIHQPKNMELFQGENDQALSVSAKTVDGGRLTYQWYKSNSADTPGTMIHGAVFNTYIPKADIPGTQYYYCVITNFNEKATGNQRATIETEKACVVVANSTTPDLTKITSSAFNIHDGYIENISIGTTVKEVIDKIDQSEFIKIFSGNDEVSLTQPIATGMTICLIQNNIVKDQVTVVVLGDTDGNGLVNIDDYNTIGYVAVGMQKKEDAYFKACDINMDGIIDALDVAKMDLMLSV